MKKEVIEYYESLIKDQDSQLLELSSRLEQEMKSEKAVFGDRILCPFLRPNFILRSEYEYIKQVIGILMQAIAKIYEATRQIQRLRDQLDLSAGEERLIRIDPGYQGFSVTSRIDSFFTDGALQFVELNAETPAGLAYQDVLVKLFLDLPVMKEFTKKYSIVPMNIREKLLTMLLDVYDGFCTRTSRTKKDFPNIAIVDWKNLPTQSEFELICKFLESKGYRSIIADPEELEYGTGGLYCKGFQIDLVYRRIVTSEFLEKYDDSHPLIRAYENHDACVINHFRTKLTHKKMIFGLLTEEANQNYFSDREREIIRKHIPWTRKVAEGSTLYKGTEIDLCSFIIENKDRLVMKPNDKYGGKGIYIGWESSGEQWEQCLKDALASSYVVQEKVQTAQETFPTMSNGHLVYDPYVVDLDPYIFYGREVYGCLTRLSSSSLCNVSSGGGQVPTFIVEKI